MADPERLRRDAEALLAYQGAVNRPGFPPNLASALLNAWRGGRRAVEWLGDRRGGNNAIARALQGGDEAIRYAVGPQGYEALSGAAAVGNMMSPAEDMRDIQRGSDKLVEGKPSGLLDVATGTLGTLLGPVDNAVEPLLGMALVGPRRGRKTLTMPDGTRVPRPKNMQQVPDIRNMDVDEAVALARQEPHLIPSGAGTEGAYSGGPRNIKSRRGLTNQRRKLDESIDAGAEGGDWYDRYRAGVAEVSDPRDTQWMANLEGQYSAGVSPEGELGFALKDTNATIATGDPGKPARPAQAEASRRAFALNDPMLFQLGPKTGEYAHRVRPGNDSRTATGVNDFRHARELGYTQSAANFGEGAGQRDALGMSQHRYSDYETALAVDRANQRRLAGRSDWTGEQIQATAWVRQKADDFFKRYRSSYLDRAKAVMRPGDNRDIEEVARDIAFQDANRTIADFFPKHTAYATHEAQPYAAGGHLPGSAAASSAERAEFAADPRSTWATAPGGRDALYAGMRAGDTGYAMRVRPSLPMQGVYNGPQGREFNPGWSARPLVAFESTPAGHVVPEADKGLMDAAEAVRGYVDYQGATPWHKAQANTKVAGANSLLLESPSVGPLTPERLAELEEMGKEMGLPDIVDRGEGALLTNFDGGPPISAKALREATERAREMGYTGKVGRVRVDSGYPGYEGAWEEGVGSGAATRKLLDRLYAQPAATRQAIDQNPSIPERALARVERDEEWASRWGATREDVQTARRIIGEGPGWIGRLETALKAGVLLPAVGFAILSEVNREAESPTVPPPAS